MNGNLVKELRNNGIRITNKPVVYYWWFKKHCVPRLLKILENHYDRDKIKDKTINENVFSLLYVGCALDGHERLVKYHILDRSDFHKTGVQNKRLSSLRQTLCGLLKYPMSSGKKNVNIFMDDNCYVEWEIVTAMELNNNEKKFIVSNYLPLNYQNTKGILTTQYRRILSQSKSKMRR